MFHAPKHELFQSDLPMRLGGVIIGGYVGIRCG